MARRRVSTDTPAALANVVAQLSAIERTGGDGTLRVGRGTELKVSSLDKHYFDKGVTKGALMRYYATVWPVLQPHMEDRPLVLKRYPDGVGGPMFFQQNAGEHVPDVVRVETFNTKDGGPKPRIVGGDLTTLLYTVQIGAIEVHPWLSKVGDVNAADRCLIDLDPGDDVLFPDVVALARDVLEIVHHCALPAAVKTSGSSGIHVVIPLPPKTSYDTSAALGMLVARAVTAQCPERATVERSLRARPAGTIYVDAMQNARGKSMACAYSVRARDGAPVSAPLEERELTSRLRTAAYSLQSIPRRVARVGDLWGTALAVRTGKRALMSAMTALERIVDGAGEASAPRRGQKRSVRGGTDVESRAGRRRVGRS